MRYWDSSALVPLVIAEEASRQARQWLQEDPLIVTWTWSLIELTSAVGRRARFGEITHENRRHALEFVKGLASEWYEVDDLLPVRQRALTLLARHPLRAADAAQLGAALLVAEDDPGSLTFVCLDDRLALAAEKEGLRVL